MAITVVGDVSLDQTAYDLFIRYPLRSELYFDRVADVRTTNLAHPGSAVKFTIESDLAIASTPINESTDITPATMADSQVTLTLAEYGNAVKTTALLRGTSFVPVNPIVANVIGYNAGISLDSVVSDVIYAGSNVRFAGAATLRTQVTPATLLTGRNVARSRAELAGANVQRIGGFYAGFIHPDVAYDLMGDSGFGNWRDPHTYSQPGEIWTGELGAFEGVRFIETPRAKVVADAGSSTTLTDVYLTVILGREALAKAFSTSDGNGSMPKIIPGPVTDTLRRFVPLGWYWLGAYGVFRQAALRRWETGSSIGTNA
jgi:N4-gp56 family major capsid protein